MDIIQTVATMGILILAFFRGDHREGVLLYALAGIATITFGLTWTGTYDSGSDYVLSICAVGIGIYCLVLAVFSILNRIRS